LRGEHQSARGGGELAGGIKKRQKTENTKGEKSKNEGGQKEDPTCPEKGEETRRRAPEGKEGTKGGGKNYVGQPEKGRSWKETGLRGPEKRKPGREQGRVFSSFLNPQNQRSEKSSKIGKSLKNIGFLPRREEDTRL